MDDKAYISALYKQAREDKEYYEEREDKAVRKAWSNGYFWGVGIMFGCQIVLTIVRTIFGF